MSKSSEKKIDLITILFGRLSYQVFLALSAVGYCFYFRSCPVSEFRFAFAIQICCCERRVLGIRVEVGYFHKKETAFDEPKFMWVERIACTVGFNKMRLVFHDYFLHLLL